MYSNCLRVLKRTRLVWVSILFYIAVYGIMFIPHYSIDSYTIWLDLTEIVRAPISSGRLVFALWGWLFCWLNFNPVQCQWIGVLLFILSLALSHILVYKSFLRLFPLETSKYKKVALWLSVGVIFCNPFIGEWFYFVETSVVYATALTFCALAVQQITKKKTKNWIFAFLYVVIAVYSYQAIVSNFLILGAIYFLIENRFRWSWQSFWSVVGVVVMSAIASMTALLCAKIIPALAGMEGRFSEVSIWENIKYIISCQAPLWKSGLRLMLGYWLIVAFVLCMAVVVMQLCMKKEWMGLAWTMVVLTGCYLSSFLVHYVNSEHWIVPRTMVPFFCFIAVAFICAIWLWPDQKRYSAVATGLILIFVFGCGFQVIRVTCQQIQTNQMDKNEILQIDEAIRTYEKENDVQITKCTISTDQYITYVYPQITLFSGEVGERILSVKWAAVDAIEFYTGRTLQELPTPEEITERFSQYDWGELNVSEQLVFEGDTVHICVY